MSSTTRTIDQLCLSQFNSRRNEQDANTTAAFERSFIDRYRRGRDILILPLVVHPMKGNPRKWAVHAGGRRYRAAKACIERGDLPCDVPIEVIVRDVGDAELIEDSTTENLLRKDLRAYEICLSVVNAHRKGDAPQAIADAMGQELSWVLQALRLGTLAKPIFQAFAAEQISIDQARAYGATEDHALQLAAFELLDRLPDVEKTPARIRSHLRVGDAEAARLLRFVGVEAYLAAGGRLEPDLFAGPGADRARVVDPGLLQKLSHDRLAGVREKVRADTGRPDLRFERQPPAGEFGVEHALRIDPRDAADGTVKLPDGDVVGVIAIPEAGEPEITFWWASRKAKHGGGKPRPTLFERLSATPAAPAVRTGAAIAPAAGSVARPVADAMIRRDSGLTQESIDIFRSVRTAILRAALVEDAAVNGDVALDYFVWVQLRIALRGSFAHELGMRGIAPAPRAPDSARDHGDATDASRSWGQALYELTRQSFMTGDDLVAAYRDYCASAPALKRTAIAVVAGLALDRSLNADGYRLPVHDAVAADLALTDDIELREYWRPTAAMLDLLPRDEQLKIAEPFVEASSFAPWSRLKGAELTPLVLAAVTGASNVVRASMAAAAASWVHPLLRFGAPIAAAPAEADVGAELQEAAE